MKILFDEGVPQAIRKHLPEHEAHTVQERGWDTVQNGALLNLIEQEGYELFLTADKNMNYQQTLAGRPFSILVLSTNHWPTISANTQSIVDAVEQTVSGRVLQVDCGHYPPHKQASPLA